MFELISDGFQEMTDAGTVRPSNDPTMRALFVLSMELGVLLLRPMIESVLGEELTNPAVIKR